MKKVDGGAAKIELLQDDFAPASRPSDTAGGQWIVMGDGMVVGCKDLITYLKKISQRALLILPLDKRKGPVFTCT